MDLLRTTKDRERVKSILEMVELIEKRISKEDKSKFTPLILSDYYEIIKELLTAVLLCDGFKTLSHRDLIKYLEEKFTEFNRSEIVEIDRLRIMRNRIVYEGVKTPSNYLKNFESSLQKIIKKLKLLINKKLK